MESLGHELRPRVIIIIIIICKSMPIKSSPCLLALGHSPEQPVVPSDELPLGLIGGKEWRQDCFIQTTPAASLPAVPLMMKCQY